MSKNFLLITVEEREISTEFFSTFEDAKAEMMKQFAECFSDEDRSEFDFEDAEYYGDEYGWNETSACLNDGPNHSNFDWKIIEIPKS